MYKRVSERAKKRGMMLASISQKSGMKKQLRNRISSLIKLVSINSIRPFSEKPSITAQNASEPGAPPINHATELFERFTGEIIRERVIFTR